MLVLIYLACVAAFSGAVLWIAEGEALEQLERRGRADLALAGDSLKNEFGRYRSLAVVFADNPLVTGLLDEGQPQGQVGFLQRLADKTGSLDVIVVDAAGVPVGAARAGSTESHAGRPYFERAKDGAMGVYHLLSERYARRAFLFAAPVFADDGPVRGAVIVAADVEAVEAEWRGDRPTVFFTDELGVIFVSNRSELVFRSRTGDVAAAGQSAEYHTGVVAPFRAVDESTRQGLEIWTMDGGRYLPDRGLHLSLPLPVIGLTGEALMDMAPVRKIALLQAAVAAALCLAFGVMLFWLIERRRTLAEANARLEARVIDRTAALRAVNNDLRREVAERREAQAQLTRAQADLVQAGKLSALGQMSAGISHELNQPLMAIRSFAENAEAFLAKGKPEVAAQNLSRISDLSRRMGRIIRNLRAFARQQSDGMRDVDLVAVVDGAIEMVAGRLHSGDVTLNWQAPAGPVHVRGGDVRLQQVVLNLVTNAIDAMEGADRRVLTITLDQLGARVELSVHDTGPGIEEPEKVFEPFYSTKQLPTEEGMGLGLSISYGLVQSFGGEIRGRNHQQGGAVFTVTLDAVAERDAA